MVNKKMWITAIAVMMLLNSDYQKEAKAATLLDYHLSHGVGFQIDKQTISFLTREVTNNTLVFKGVTGQSPRLIGSGANCDRGADLIGNDRLDPSSSLEMYLKSMEENPISGLVKAEGESFFVEDIYHVFSAIYEWVEFYVGPKGLNSVMKIESSSDNSQEIGPQISKIGIKGIELYPGVMTENRLSPEQTRRMLLYGSATPKQTVIFHEDASLWYIARDYGLTEAELHLLNPQIKELEWDELLGMELDVTPLNPLIEIKLETEESYRQALPYQTEYIDDETLLEGQVERLREGKNGEVLTRIVTNFAGETIIEEVTTEKVENEVVAKGTKVVNGMGTGHWIWPTSNQEIVHDYLSSVGHYGINIRVTPGEAVFGTDNGVIEAIEDQSVLINHRNGYFSRYGNLNRLNVDLGQEVEAGQVIGRANQLGHLYFEIRTNSGNPATYAPNPLDFF